MSNEVFFLGAGFSKAINDKYPTLKTLTEEINHNLITEKGSIMTHFRDEIPEGYKSNLELLLSFLASNLPYKTPAQVDEDNALYKNITSFISNYFINKEEQNSNFLDSHITLANFLIKQKVPCITLNYDTLLEKLIYSVVSDSYKNVNSNYSTFYKIPITNLSYRIPNGRGSFASYEDDFNKERMPELIKLHGSINWLSDGNILYSDENKDNEQLEILRLGLNKVIVPPIMDKTTLYKYDIFKILWDKAYKKLAKAKYIYICGFSFPATDLSVRFLFQSALSNNKMNPIIYVINTKEALEQSSEYYLEQRYNEIFKGFDINYAYCCKDSLDRFVQEVIQPQCKEVENAAL